MDTNDQDTSDQDTSLRVVVIYLSSHGLFGGVSRRTDCSRLRQALTRAMCYQPSTCHLQKILTRCSGDKVDCYAQFLVAYNMMAMVC
jgi:hypothetical protein